MNYKKFDDKLIEKYYQKKCSPEEKQIVEYWFADIKYSSEITAIAQKQWVLTGAEGNDKKLLNDILYKIHYNIHLEECRQTKDKKFLTRTKSILAYVFAAVITLLLVVNIGLWRGGGRLLDKQTVFTEIHAPYGSRIKFNLPDGSSGWLNSGSSLKFPAKFANRERNVLLNGEGYFNVIRNPKKSFIVSTKYYQVRALGTSFNVQAYSDLDSFEEVTLDCGKVQIEKMKRDGTFKKILDLKPGQHAQMDYFSNSIKIVNNEADKYTAWKDGKMIFRNDPLEHVIRHLQRCYNVQIEVEDEQLLRYHFHATFEEETLFETLRLLKLSSAISYKICKREKNEDGSYKKRKIILFCKN